MTDRPADSALDDHLPDAVTIRCSLGTITGYPDDAAEWGEPDAIARLWKSPALREAVMLASPVLAAELAKLRVTAGTDTPLKKRKRLHKGLLKYALRMSTRCTPFGMFAGVAVLPIGDEEPVLGKCHTRHVRATGAVTRRLLDKARAMPQTRLFPNPALMKRADRLVVSVMRGVDDTHTLASVRVTGPARLAVATAAAVPTRRDIEKRVAEAYPSASSAKVQKLIDDLLAAEVLLCDFEHSAFDGDPLARVPDTVGGAAEIRAALARYSDAENPLGDGSLDMLLRICSADGLIQRNVHVDLELDVSGQVPASVVVAARDAVTALTATMAHRPATPALDEFSAMFFERYGNALVPFLTAVDEELGIGYPRVYETASSPAAATDDRATVERRRDLIARLLHQAASDGLGTVDLTDADLSGFPASEGMPSSYDIMLRLHREPTGLQTTVTGIGFPGGSAIGRFTAVIPRARAFAHRCVEFDTTWWAAKTRGRGVLCGVDYIAGTDSVNAVAATAPLYPVTLAVNARPHRPSDTVFTLSDIYLGYADGHVRTVLADGTPVSTRQLNMATTNASAKAIRLLREISDAGIRVPFWSWGEAEAILNHLPAVRYRGVILAEERWRYPMTADRTRTALQDWIVETRVSRYVLVGPRDTRLHLDTRHSTHLDLLLDEIVAGNHWLFRAPTPEQMGAVGDRDGGRHPAEAVVTVAAPNSRRPEPDLTDRPLLDPADDKRRLLTPGGSWTSFAITLSSHAHDRFVKDFADTFPNLAGSWYFVRYRESDRDQLRLRVRRPVTELAGVLAWLAEARLAGRIGDYTIPVYHRELERYGGSQSFTCYERLFCVETANIVTLLPIIDNDAPELTSTRLTRPGVETAAGVLAGWLDGLDPARVDSAEVVELAVETYSRELGKAVHGIKQEVRRLKPRFASGNRFADTLRAFWANPEQRDAVTSPAVLQSASHMLSIRLGLRRHEEFAAMWLIKTERNRLEQRGARRP